MNSEQNEKANSLALDILNLSRNTLVVDLRFMNVALAGFKFYELPFDNSGIATDGRNIAYNALVLLKNYKQERERSVRDLLHLVLHCVFRHFFVDLLINHEMWDLACDIVVENIINELDIDSAKASRQAAQIFEINKLKNRVKFITAEVLYRYFLDNRPDKNLYKLFKGDSHEFWYERWEISSGDPSVNLKSSEDGENILSVSAAREALAESWKEISEKIQTDLETFAKRRGDTAESLVQNLAAVNREKYDYTAFLKKFAVMGEAMKINDDEFDYIFYTLGLKMYENMPLIEPLEYKDVKRIREFVIAIDTSGSVSGELVQKFVQKTYNILKNEESFFRKINLHIIQCDAEIQEDAKITSQEEFDEYLKTMQLQGFGGTDFRPVFSYVDELIEKREFTNLKGLIYFTDGFGVFPEHQPPYNTAFVYVNDDYDDPEVPIWAIKLVLQSEGI